MENPELPLIHHGSGTIISLCRPKLALRQCAGLLDRITDSFPKLTEWRTFARRPAMGRHVSADAKELSQLDARQKLFRHVADTSLPHCGTARSYVTDAARNFCSMFRGRLLKEKRASLFAPDPISRD
jgi:hypothetical protein